ncbi:Ribosomal protein L18e/L15 superfamily protein [Zea mays]|uniref:Ribosomal protein L18e/L15 superfamily protein n=1 Tax=Zea mays TaxID=4577 RepID=A0A1D6MRK5_MAIZE|nr:Ribosomal protein L18e/L15 superfamily protein [Zea mays]
MYKLLNLSKSLTKCTKLQTSLIQTINTTILGIHAPSEKQTQGSRSLQCVTNGSWNYPQCVQLLKYKKLNRRALSCPNDIHVRSH